MDNLNRDGTDIDFRVESDLNKEDYRKLRRLIRAKAQKLILQRRPMTIAIAKVCWDNEEYIDWATSKVCWPDGWDHKRGSEIAIGRAINNLTQQIVGTKSIDFYALTDTPHGIVPILPIELFTTLEEIVPSIA